MKNILMSILSYLFLVNGKQGEPPNYPDKIVYQDKEFTSDEFNEWSFHVHNQYMQTLKMS